MKPYGLELLSSCVDPVVVNHPKGHTVPRLGKYTLTIVVRMLLALFWGLLLKSFIFFSEISDEKSLPTVESFLEKIQTTLVETEEH